MKPSAARVLVLLRERGVRGLSDLEAIERLHQTRLSGRVLELRALGHDIETRWESGARGVRYARYVLRERPVQLDLFRDPPASGRREVTPHAASTARGAVAPIASPARAG